MRLGREKIQEEARRLGVLLIAGGVAARVLQHSVGTLEAIWVVFLGVVCVTVGSLQIDGGEHDD